MHGHLWILEYGGIQEVFVNVRHNRIFRLRSACLVAGRKVSMFIELLNAKTYAELQSFPAECTTIYGTLLLSDCADCTDLLPISNVNEIVMVDPTKKLIQIENNEALVSLRGIETLLQNELHGDVTIRQNRQLSSLSQFSNLHTIRGDVTLQDNTKLPDLSGFGECTHHHGRSHNRRKCSPCND